MQSHDINDEGDLLLRPMRSLMPGKPPEDSSVTGQPPAPPARILEELPHELLLLIIRNAVSSDKRPGIPENEMVKNIQQAAHTTTALSQTCKLFYALTKEVSLPRDAQRLITLIVEGKAEQAKAMIRENPKLMFAKIKGEVETPGSGISDEGLAVHGNVTAQSPFQIALGEGDGDIYRYMALFFDMVLDSEANPIGRQLAHKQFYEKFPDGNFDYPPCEYDLNKEGMPFSSIIKAISNDLLLCLDRGFNQDRQPTEVTKAVLRQFRQDFMPGIFTTGHHFNLNNLVKALEVYGQHFDSWNFNQRSLFWCQVIGYLQRLVPAVVAQAFCQGLYNLLNQKQPLNRELELHNDVTNSKASYYVDSGHSGLGFDFGIYVLVGGATLRMGMRGAVVRDLLKKYVEQTQQSLADLRSSCDSGYSNNLNVSPTRPQNGA